MLAESLGASTSPLGQALAQAFAKAEPATPAELARVALRAAAGTESGAAAVERGAEVLAVADQIAKAMFGAGGGK